MENKDDITEGTEGPEVVQEYDLRPLIDSAIKQAKTVLGEKKLNVEVEMTEDMTVRISAKPL